MPVTNENKHQFLRSNQLLAGFLAEALFVLPFLILLEFAFTIFQVGANFSESIVNVGYHVIISFAFLIAW